MTPYRRFKNNHPHAAVNTVDQEKGRGKSLQQNMIPFGDMFLMSSDSQGLIHDFITNNHNHSSIKKNINILNFPIEPKKINNILKTLNF